MNTRACVAAFVVSVLLAFALSDVTFAEHRRVEGVVKVVKEGVELKAIELVSETIKYAVKLDQNGRKLEAYDGRTVIVTGEVDDIKKEITVSSFEEKKPGAEKPGAQQ